MGLDICEPMFYNSIHTEQMIGFRRKDDIYMEQSENKDNVGYMTNKQYREELNKMFASIENNSVLRYFYMLLPKLIKEWQ